MNWGIAVVAAPSIANVADMIKAALREAASPAAAKQGLTYFKEPVKMIGVNAPTMRLIARHIYLLVKPHWHLVEALALCENLLPDRRFEVKVVAMLVLERFAKEFTPDLLPTIKRWIDDGYCASWGMIDCLCAGTLGPLLVQYPALIKQTRTWTASDNQWLRRAAAVSLTKAARRGQLLDQAYHIAERLMSDDEDLVQKATGWLLRETGRTDRRRLQKFLLLHGPKIARTTLRYAIEHFDERERKRMLTETKETRARNVTKRNSK